MKFAELKSIGHNIADSLASGIGLAIDCYQSDIFGEATRSSGGYIIVDFLAGRSIEGEASTSLDGAIALYRDFLPDLCKSHGVDVQAFKALTARFGVDPVYRGHFTVTVEDQTGKRSVDHYVGSPGRRLWRKRQGKWSRLT